MPEMSTEGTGSASLEAKVFRVDGTEEELGVIARTPSLRRFVCESSAANVEFPGSDPPLPAAVLSRGAILIMDDRIDMTVTYGTIRELSEGEE